MSDLQRVSALDWQFLLGIEDKSETHMHIGSVMTFEGPAPAADDLREFIGSRIHLAPRFGQKLVFQAIASAGKPVGGRPQIPTCPTTCLRRPCPSRAARPN